MRRFLNPKAYGYRYIINYKIVLCTYALLWLCGIPVTSCAQIITTVAGNGFYGYSGDGGAATAAQFSGPIGIAVDGGGNLYIADLDSARIRKVDASGIITTIAGNGTPGYSGDGGIATAAQLSTPTGVAVDAIGNVYIADQGNNRIRKVDTTGVITTIAGTGTPGYSGDGGVATAAQLNIPYSVAADGIGNIFIADEGNQRIRKVNISGIITTIAGNGTYGFSGDGGAATAAELKSPTGVAVDASGNVFITDGVNMRIRKASASGIITTIAGNGSSGYSGDGGAATSAELWSPFGVAVDSSGNVYIADKGNNCIRKVNTSGAISTIAGNDTAGYSGDGGAATAAKLAGPWGVAVAGDGNIYIADYYNYRVRKTALAQTGTITTGTRTANIKVYPNPSTGIITLELPTVGPAYISVTTTKGQLMLSKKSNTLQTDIDCTNWGTGEYLLVVTVDGKVCNEKIVKK